MDVPAIMNARHLPLYDKAFGEDPDDWQAASPYHRLAGPMPPILAVCRKRSKDSCPANRAFAEKAAKLGSKIEILPMDLTHGEINKQLGLPSAYATPVDDFMRSLGWIVEPVLAAFPPHPPATRCGIFTNFSRTT